MESIAETLPVRATVKEPGQTPCIMLEPTSVIRAQFAPGDLYLLLAAGTSESDAASLAAHLNRHLYAIQHHSRAPGSGK